MYIQNTHRIMDLCSFGSVAKFNNSCHLTESAQSINQSIFQPNSNARQSENELVSLCWLWFWFGFW